MDLQKTVETLISLGDPVDEAIKAINAIDEQIAVLTKQKSELEGKYKVNQGPAKRFWRCKLAGCDEPAKTGKYGYCAAHVRHATNAEQLRWNQNRDKRMRALALAREARKNHGKLRAVG